MKTSKTNANGIKKLAHTALNTAIRQLSWEIRKERKAIDDGTAQTDGVPTLDLRNELDHEREATERDSETAQGPVGLTKKHSSWQNFYNLYLGYTEELLCLQEGWANTKAPAAYFDLVYGGETRPVKISEGRMAELVAAATAMEISVKELIQGENNRMAADRKAILDLRSEILGRLAMIKGRGFTELETFESHEQARLLQAMVTALVDHKASYVAKGWASRPEGMANVMFMNQDIKEARDELALVNADAA